MDQLEMAAEAAAAHRKRTVSSWLTEKTGNRSRNMAAPLHNHPENRAERLGLGAKPAKDRQSHTFSGNVFEAVNAKRAITGSYNGQKKQVVANKTERDSSDEESKAKCIGKRVVK
jgi:hypothetical protein